MVERLGSVLMYGIFVCLFIFGSVLIHSQLIAGEAAAVAFNEPIDSFPNEPQPWQPTDWDVVVHSKEVNTWSQLDTVSADFSPTCAPSPASHPVTAHEDAVFVCDGTVQTALNATGYGMIYLTPNQMADFGNEEAVIRFDVSTLRPDGKDFLNIWVTPFEDNLQLPIQDWLPAATGEPKNGILLRTGLTLGQTRIEASVIRDFVASNLYDNYTTIESVLSQNGLTPSDTRLETVEVRLSADHISVCFPDHAHCFLDTAISPPLDWTQGIVQFGHHSWNINESNTYRWDNFSIDPAIPFGMIQATNRMVSPAADTFTFDTPAPANSFLRFVGVGDNLEVSFDNGLNWQTATLQAQAASEYKSEQFRTYWMAIPPTVQTVKLRGDNWWGGTWSAHTASFWTSTPGEIVPTATPDPNITPTNTQLPPPPTATLPPTDTPQPTTPATATPQLPLEIEFSNISGVSGYEIGVFGEGFGGAGTLTILGAQATVLEWEDGFIRAIVPNVADGTGELRLMKQNGDATAAPFTVYSIDPNFLLPAQQTYDEISFDETLFLDGLEFGYCNDIETGAAIEIGRFLTNYRCGSGGFVGSGEAVFAADSSLGTTATLAFRSDSVLSGQHIYQFTSDTYWEPYHESQASWRKSYPRTYTIDVSADSTNGTDGTWTTLQTVADNNRTTRYHVVDIPAAGNYRWLRMRVTDGYADYSEPAGRDFLLRQVHVYKANGTGRPDSIAIYGDSLTFTAFDIIGPRGFSAQAQTRRLSDNALPLTLYGLPGAKADRLMDTDYFDSDLYDAFAIDNMADNALYWGIALGTNDIGGGAVNLNDPNSFLMQFDERLDGAVQELISRGRVPIIARLPDTDESINGYGDTASKQKVLTDIDTIAATYRLIPGPDFFTEFRRNIKANDASYISDDGTHHSYTGREALIAGWAEAFTAPFPQNAVTPTPEPTVTVPAGTPAPTLTPVPSPTAPPSDAGIEIEVANSSGVIGYEIGMFGSGFGNSAGSVEILGANAQVVEWTDSFIRAIVPAVPDGDGYLRVQSAANRNAYAPFTVYTINPNFLQAPEMTFDNIAAGRFVHTQNAESWFCYQQPSNASADPSEFLTDYRCGNNGITRTGSAKFTADSALGEVAIVAIDLEQELSGDYYFNYFVNGNWYPRPDSGSYPESNPRDYLMQVSADSTNGIDGNWQTILTVTGNNRSQRLHKLTVPAGGYHWLRMYVTDGNASETANPGRDFGLREIRLFAPNGNSSNLDSFAIYGDSLTASDFETIGTLGLAAKIKTLRGEEQDMMFTTYGLSGQNSSGLTDQPDGEVDIYDALALDDMQANARFWGIALGTNDALDSEDAIGVPGFNITEYGNRLDAAVADLIALGRVPIVARIPDTDETRGGYGTLVTKRKILGDIDAVAAKYRLIPGPDFYTVFRNNVERDGSSYLSGDGTHHSDLGMLKLIDMWGETFVGAVPAVEPVDPLPTPLPTYTPTPLPTATSSPVPTAQPTATNTPPPTATPLPQDQIYVGDYAAETGETVAVTILLGSQSNAIGSATIDLIYDAALLDVVECSADPATQFDTALCNPNYSSNGVRVTLTSNTGVMMAGSLAEFVFTVTGAGGNVSELLLNAATFTDTNGNPLTTSLRSGSVTIGAEVVDGDVSCDSQRNVVDAMYISQYVVGARSAEAGCPLEENTLDWSQCDVDANGLCNIVDAMYVAQCEVGISNALCIQQRRAARRALAAAQLWLTPLGDGQVAVMIDLPDDTPFGALTLDVTFDPALITAMSCSVGNNLVGACNVSFAANTVRLTGASFVPQTEAVNFGTLYFEPVEAETTSAEVTASVVHLTSSNGDTLTADDATETVLLANEPTAIRLNGATQSADATQSLGLLWTFISLSILLIGTLLFGWLVVKK